MEKRRMEILIAYAAERVVTVGAFGIVLNIIERLERGEKLPTIVETYNSGDDRTLANGYAIIEAISHVRSHYQDYFPPENGL